jgi:SagB-type dehydrogenase family enzyme
VTLAVGNVDDLRVGLYRYDIRSHELIKTAEGDKREALCRASLGQSCVRDGALVLAFSAFYDRVTNYYGERGIRYVFMEVGHAAQNVHLQAISLSIGTVVIGAFRDPKVKRLLHLHDREEPLYLMPLGKLPPQGR